MAVVWLILKWIVILLLAVLGLLLLVLSAVLFAPLRYEFKASYFDRTDMDLKIKWLCSLLSVRVSYHQGIFSIHGKLFGKNVRKEEGEDPLSSVPFSMPEKPEPSLPLSERKAGTAPEETVKTEQKEQKEEAGAEKRSRQEEAVPGKKRKDKKEGKGKTSFSFQKICDKIGALKEKKEQVQDFLEDPENRKAFSLIKRQLYKLFRHILPRRFQARLRFGFDDPAVTGQVLGIICMFYALYGNNLSLEPDFNEKVLEGECWIKGRIRAGAMIAILGRLFFQKRIRSWIFKLIK